MAESLSDGSEFPPTDARVGVIMGSKNDWDTMRAACDVLDRLGIQNERTVVSAHRTPARMVAYAQSARRRGIQVIIAGAGGAAHLPGMVASETTLPVIGVPVQSRALSGLDSLLSIVQMPGGIPVATMAIGSSGAKNAGLLAARILAISDPELQRAVADFIEQQTQQVLADTELD
jgi:5-(carboxyamino)imidazole ribonucleotide mutase